MKTKLLLLLLLANFSFYAQTNLVPNGDFESWSSSTPTDWFRNFSGFVSESSVAQSGSSSAKLLITSSANFLNSAYFQAQAGKTYRVTVYHRVASGTLTNIELSLYHKPSTFKSELVKKDDAIFSSTTWRKLEFEYTTTATEDIEVDIWATGVTNSEILLDNVSVVDVNEPVYTSIPDVNFENELIDYGFDSGTPDGKVLTANIATVKYLNFNKSSISDLTGIEDFTELEELIITSSNLTSLNISKNLALTYLDFGYNNVTEINVSQNTKLKDFYCHGNQITSLDVSQNVLLEGFMCQDNKLTAIDVSHNPELGMFDCLDNQIKSIDISKNPKIYELACENNQLTYLNLKNGNNTKIRKGFTNFKNNPNLTCILVDDVDYANANWAEWKDATASYSTACTLGLATSVFDKVAVYPNPTKGDVTITNLSLNKATVYSSTGQLVKSFALDTANTNNTISLSGLPKGIYYVYLINQDAASAKKVIVE